MILHSKKLLTGPLEALTGMDTDAMRYDLGFREGSIAFNKDSRFCGLGFGSSFHDDGIPGPAEDLRGENSIQAVMLSWLALGLKP